MALLAFLCRLIANSSIGLLAGLFYATDWITIVHTPMMIAVTIYSITLGLAILLYVLALEKPRASLTNIARRLAPWHLGPDEAGSSGRPVCIHHRPDFPRKPKLEKPLVLGDLPSLRCSVDSPQRSQVWRSDALGDRDG